MLVLTTGRGSTAAADDVPNVIMLLLLIGFEPSTSAELRSEIMVTIDILGSLMPSSSAGSSDMVCCLESRTLAATEVSVSQERTLCIKILRFAESMTPVNKSFLMTFFCGGSPQIARLVRWLSQSLLLGDYILQEVRDAVLHGQRSY